MSRKFQMVIDDEFYAVVKELSEKLGKPCAEVIRLSVASFHWMEKQYSEGRDVIAVERRAEGIPLGPFALTRPLARRQNT